MTDCSVDKVLKYFYFVKSFVQLFTTRFTVFLTTITNELVFNAYPVDNQIKSIEALVLTLVC